MNNYKLMTDIRVSAWVFWKNKNDTLHDEYVGRYKAFLNKQLPFRVYQRLNSENFHMRCEIRHLLHGMPKIQDEDPQPVF